MAKETTKDFESVSNGLVERYNVEGLPPAVGAYRHITAVKIGTNYSAHGYELRISGMLPLNKDVDVVGDNCKEQTIKVLDNIALAVMNSAARYGVDLTREQALNCITDTLVLLSDMADFKQVNEAFSEAKMPLVCRAAFAVKELPLASKGVKIEIRANAIISVKTLA